MPAAAKPAKTVSPVRARVRMYQVGFGDAFLLSFEYAKPLKDGRAERHILIDLGTARMPTPDLGIADIARQIALDCNGALDVVVVTHRHKDHISGFGVKDAGVALDPLAPKLVVRPWTETPSLPSNAKGPVGEESVKFAAAIGQGQAFAKTLTVALDDAAPHPTVAETTTLAADQLSNKEAIARLDRWAKAADGAYLHYGLSSHIEKHVPGVKVHVLGPPTVEQWPEVAKRRANSPEYWLLPSGLSIPKGIASAAAEAAIAAGTEEGLTEPERWLVQKIKQEDPGTHLSLVRSLDDALNNTSVILLFEAGGHRMLFPGDAQIEDWSYALSSAPEHEDTAKLLREVRLYKVGHHGSRNATPRTSLFDLWGEKQDKSRPMTALMSTLSGVHGKSDDTVVPQDSLVKALRKRMKLLSTESLRKGHLSVELVADLKGDGVFAPAER